MEELREPFTANQALQLLWIHSESKDTDLNLSKAELAHLRLEVIHDWENLTTPYKDFLVSQDKLVVLSKMSNDEPIFVRCDGSIH